MGNRENSRAAICCARPVAHAAACGDYFSQPLGARPRVRGSAGAEVSILTLDGTGRELVPTAVFCGRDDCGGALTPPLSEMRAIFGSFRFSGI